mgnify:FL=1
MFFFICHIQFYTGNNDYLFLPVKQQPVNQGKKIFIDSKGSIFDTLVEMEQDLQSAISYAGGTTLQAIRKVDYVLVKNSILNGDR